MNTVLTTDRIFKPLLFFPAPLESGLSSWIFAVTCPTGMVFSTVTQYSFLWWFFMLVAGAVPRPQTLFLFAHVIHHSFFKKTEINKWLADHFPFLSNQFISESCHVTNEQKNYHSAVALWVLFSSFTINSLFVFFVHYSTNELVCQVITKILNLITKQFILMHKNSQHFLIIFYKEYFWLIKSFCHIRCYMCHYLTDRSLSSVFFVLFSCLILQSNSTFFTLLRFFGSCQKYVTPQKKRPTAPRRSRFFMRFVLFSCAAADTRYRPSSGRTRSR